MANVHVAPSLYNISMLLSTFIRVTINQRRVSDVNVVLVGASGVVLFRQRNCPQDSKYFILSCWSCCSADCPPFIHFKLTVRLFPRGHRLSAAPFQVSIFCHVSRPNVNISLSWRYPSCYYNSGGCHRNKMNLTVRSAPLNCIDRTCGRRCDVFCYGILVSFYQYCYYYSNYYTEKNFPGGLLLKHC
jgi:hypothetical protein